MSGCASVAEAPRAAVVAPVVTVAPLVEAAASPRMPRSLALRTALTPAGVEVRVALTGYDAALLELVIADAHEGAPGFEQALRSIDARDARGALPLGRHARRGEHGDALVVYTSTRRPVGDVVVEYVAEPRASTETTGLQRLPGATAGLGASFLLLPADPTPADLLVQTAGGVASIGDGALHAPPGRLRSAMFAWGALQPVEGAGVRGVWVGVGLDEGAVLGLASQSLEVGERVFGPLSTKPVVFALPSLGPTGMLRGAAQPGLLVLQTGGRAPPPALLKLMVAHELLHQWIGIGVRIAGREGTRHWFSEGFTVHFARELALQGGLIELRGFAEDVGVSTSRYFTNPYRTASNRAIAELMHTTPTHERLPYDRGSLLALELDARIRAATGNARSLADFLKALLSKAASRAPAPDGARFVQLDEVRGELRSLAGDEAVERMEAVAERGDDPDPPTWALGPCFARERRVYGVGASRVEGFAWRVDLRGGDACKRRGAP